VKKISTSRKATAANKLSTDSKPIATQDATGHVDAPTDPESVKNRLENGGNGETNARAEGGLGGAD
jgi:hypothetical protein